MSTNRELPNKEMKRTKRRPGRASPLISVLGGPYAMRGRVVTSLVASLCVVGCHPVRVMPSYWAGPPCEKSGVSGSQVLIEVVDAQFNPLPGVSVDLLPLTSGGHQVGWLTTDTQGRVVATKLADGMYRVQVRLTGYESVDIEDVYVSAGCGVALTVPMKYVGPIS